MFAVLIAWVRLLRPLHWSKNLLVFAALVFARQTHVPEQVGRSFTVFVVFCLLASALYVFNDLMDREADRRHPGKRLRPVASGAVSPRVASVLGLILAIAGLSLAAKLGTAARVCVLGYTALGLSYTLLLKRAVILDVLAVAAGFVLRASAGAYAIRVEISPWLLICTMLLALFLGLAKRRHELATSARPRTARRVLGDYNLPLLDQMIAISASATLMAYVLYTFAERTTREFPSRLMPLSIPFVLFGIFRYLYLVYARRGGGEPERLLVRDIPLLLNIVLWLGCVALVLG